MATEVAWCLHRSQKVTVGLKVLLLPLDSQKLVSPLLEKGVVADTCQIDSGRLVLHALTDQYCYKTQQ